MSYGISRLLFYDDSLIVERYVEYMSEIIDDSLHDLDLVSRQNVAFQQDGAPAHSIEKPAMFWTIDE